MGSRTKRGRVVEIGLNGFGVLGQELLLRLFNNPSMQIVAINETGTSRENAIKQFVELAQSRAIAVPQNTFGSIDWLCEAKPRKLPWAKSKTKVDVVVEASRLFKRRELYCQSNGGRIPVVMTGDLRRGRPDITFVPGINELVSPPRHVVICIGSDRTQSICPVLHVLHQNFSVQRFAACIHRLPYVGRPWMIAQHRRHMRDLVRVLPWARRRGAIYRVEDPFADSGVIWLDVHVGKEPDREELVDALREAAANQFQQSLFVDDGIGCTKGERFSCMIDTSRIDAKAGRLWIEIRHDPIVSYIERLYDTLALLA